MLEVNDLTVKYGALTAVHGLSLTVGEGEAVALLGANGAGKTTAVEAIAGLHDQRDGEVRFQGREISRWRASRIARAGMALVPQWRELFGNFTVMETLEIGGHARNGRAAPDYREIFELFPRLEERRDQIASSLSGGEQQMLTIARALMSAPTMMILDEPSAGLAVGVVQDVVRAIQAVRARGVAILLVEQNFEIAGSLASRALVLSTGRVVWQGDMEDVRDSEEARQAFFL
ncbi:ABC transporter ATP-binding protein [Alloalcanivorax sp. C16-2]|uniref:ABC transporter ATP-binding protein n=1 Tax=Alloalcanivorax TaxID=3020832 RepID=UPI0019346F74|nr:ABC transporter ATP-binding protein [Alloalcanivorax marinus]MBL7249592.1 ABC transporter ATP-binding protein [Alloalcanivorax marinus]